MIGYDSLEGYMPLLMLFICVAAMLRPRRWPDEVQFGMAASNTLAPYRIQRSAWSNQVLLAAHYD